MARVACGVDNEERAGDGKDKGRRNERLGSQNGVAPVVGKGVRLGHGRDGAWDARDLDDRHAEDGGGGRGL